MRRFEVVLYTKNGAACLFFYDVMQLDSALLNLLSQGACHKTTRIISDILGFLCNFVIGKDT